jgi:hypothetical protein
VAIGPEGTTPRPALPVGIPVPARSGGQPIVSRPAAQPRPAHLSLRRLWPWLAGAGGLLFVLFVAAVVIVILVLTSTKKDPNRGVEHPELRILRIASVNNLKQLGIAMHNYHDVYNRLPATAVRSKDDKPLLSWRVTLLPYLEEQSLYNEFHLDEPWDSAHNRALLSRMPKVYRPDRSEPQWPYATYYQVFTGPDTPFNGAQALRLVEFTDGLANTFLIVEGGEPVPWTKPEDLRYMADRSVPTLGGMYQDGFNAAMADGRVRFIQADTDPKTIRALITPRGNETVKLPD